MAAVTDPLDGIDRRGIDAEFAGRRCAAIIGTGLIGQGWAIVFARKGWDVRLYDVNAAMLGEASALIRRQLDQLQAHGLLQDAAAAAARIYVACLLYTSPSPRDKRQSRMPSSA